MFREEICAHRMLTATEKVRQHPKSWNVILRQSKWPKKASWGLRVLKNVWLTRGHISRRKGGIFTLVHRSLEQGSRGVLYKVWGRKPAKAEVCLQGGAELHTQAVHVAANSPPHWFTGPRAPLCPFLIPATPAPITSCLAVAVTVALLFILQRGLFLWKVILVPLVLCF